MLREAILADDREAILREGKAIRSLLPKYQLLVLLYRARLAWLSKGGARKPLIYSVSANSAQAFNAEPSFETVEDASIVDAATTDGCEKLCITFGSEFDLGSKKYLDLHEVYSVLWLLWKVESRPISLPRFELECVRRGEEPTYLGLTAADYPRLAGWEADTKRACDAYPELKRYVQLDSDQ